MDDKLKLFRIGIEFKFTVYKGLFTKKIKYSSSVTHYKQNIIAKDFEEAKEKYLERFRFNESLFPDWYIDFQPYKINNMNLVLLTSDSITFEELKNTTNYNDFLQYIKQELNLENQLLETIK